MITLVLGGTRSGKSAIAEQYVARLAPPITYIATGASDASTPTDAAMAERIDAHRRRRPDTWTTVEAGADLAGALHAVDAGTVLVDALGTWVAAHHDFAIDLPALLAALTARRGDTVVVSDEVGLGVHPSTEIGQRFRDVLGTVNAAVAEVADEVLLVVAGRVLPLDRFPSVEQADRVEHAARTEHAEHAEHADRER